MATVALVCGGHEHDPYERVKTGIDAFNPQEIQRRDAMKASNKASK